MFICTSCAHTFEEPETYYERHTDYPPRDERWDVCPACREAGYEVAEQCFCGTYYAPDDSKMCPDCRDDTRKKFERIMRSKFSRRELEFLRQQSEDLFYADNDDLLAAG